MEITINVALVALLIVATAFFVAAEFAVVKVRPTQINQLALEGHSQAIAAQRVLANLDGYLSACQLGITITALGLGALGKPTVEHLLRPVFDQLGLSEQVSATIAFIIAFFLITFLHVVVGELAPKTVAIQKAEAVSLLLAKPLIFFYNVMYPLIWLLNGSAGKLIRLIGLKPAKEHDLAHSEEELRIILSHSLHSGEINATEYTYVTNIFEFDERIAREIMVPRTEMACVYTELPTSDNLVIMKKEGYTRFPVAEGNKDRVIGFINVKEFFIHYVENPNLDMMQLVRPVLVTNDTVPIKTLLARMQKEGKTLAVLVDEYGGTAGIVTMEDILEEIVGEIRDEFDHDEIPPVQKLGQDHFLFDGKLLLEEMQEVTGLSFESDMDTVGGWITGQVADVQTGQATSVEDWVFTIREVDGLQVKRVEVKR